MTMGFVAVHRPNFIFSPCPLCLRGEVVLLIPKYNFWNEKGFEGEASAKVGQSGRCGRKRPQAERRQATALQTDRVRFGVRRLAFALARAACRRAAGPSDCTNTRVMVFPSFPRLYFGRRKIPPVKPPATPLPLRRSLRTCCLDSSGSMATSRHARGDFRLLLRARHAEPRIPPCARLHARRKFVVKHEANAECWVLRLRRCARQRRGQPTPRRPNRRAPRRGSPRGLSRGVPHDVARRYPLP